MRNCFRTGRFRPSLGTVLLMVALLSACAAVDSFVGRFPGPRGRIVLIVEPGFASTQRILTLCEPLLQDAARNGALIEVWILHSGVVGTMVQVDLSAAGNGDFLPVGRNDVAWERQAARNAAAALVAIERAVAESTPDGTGAALFEALVWGAGRVHELGGDGPMQVVLVTGGGVHTTSTLDLRAVDFAVTSPRDAIAPVAPIDDARVAVQIVGTGAFPNVEPTPDGVWASGVRASFEAFCTASRTRSCTVTDSVLTNQEAP